MYDLRETILKNVSLKLKGLNLNKRMNNDDSLDDIGSDKEYYFENGLMVMTEQYHLRRGTCCGNKCRHCPYDHIAVPKSKTIDTDD